MQLDQKTLVRIGIAVAFVLFAALFGSIGGDIPGAEQTATSKSVPTVQATAPLVPKSSGDFDFYLLVLSWSPTHCSSDEGRGQDDDQQCRAGRPYGFVLHGMWPQYERGYPESCPSNEPRQLSREVMNRALSLSPSGRLLQHEWEKHGTCSGLSQADYFSAAELAVGSVRVPQKFRSPPKPIVTNANEVRRAFLDENRAIGDDGILVTCRRSEIGEVRVCLDKELRPRACSREVLKKHCGARHARMLAVRGDWPR